MSNRTLKLSVKKALKEDDLPPKEKHVRNLIISSYATNEIGHILDIIKNNKPFAQKNTCYKALIIIQRLLNEGYVDVANVTPCVNLLENISGYWRSYVLFETNENYSPLITQYSDLLLKKITFHWNHHDIKASFNTDIKLIVNKPNLIQLIDDLLDYQNDIIKFVHRVIDCKKSTHFTICRAVGCMYYIEESYNIYKLLIALFDHLIETTNIKKQIDKFLGQYDALRDFYFETSNITYIKTTVTVPNLPRHPPVFDKKVINKPIEKINTVKTIFDDEFTVSQSNIIIGDLIDFTAIQQPTKVRSLYNEIFNPILYDPVLTIPVEVKWLVKINVVNNNIPYNINGNNADIKLKLYTAVARVHNACDHLNYVSKKIDIKN